MEQPQKIGAYMEPFFASLPSSRIPCVSIESLVLWENATLPRVIAYVNHKRVYLHVYCNLLQNEALITVFERLLKIKKQETNEKCMHNSVQFVYRSVEMGFHFIID